MENVDFQIKFLPDDVLSISVDAPYQYRDLAAPFQVGSSVPGGTSEEAGASSAAAITYRIDSDGTIDMPIIGKVKVAGLTKQEAQSLLREKIQPYVNNPIVTINLQNFKFTVLGEVGRPNTFTVTDEKITLPQALGLAGDLTLLAQRENILVIRQQEDVKTYNYIDITKADFINSEYFYVAQNDIIVVEPSKNARSQSAAGRNITIAISSLSLVITMISLLTR